MTRRLAHAWRAAKRQQWAQGSLARPLTHDGEDPFAAAPPPAGLRAHAARQTHRGAAAAECRFRGKRSLPLSLSPCELKVKVALALSTASWRDGSSQLAAASSDQQRNKQHVCQRSNLRPRFWGSVSGLGLL